MKSETSHAANNVTRKIEGHVSGKDAWRTCGQGPLCRKGAPLMVRRAFAVALLWMHIMIRCAIIHVTIPKVHNKRPRSMGSQFSSLSLNIKDCVRPFIADRMWDDQQLSHCELSCMLACKIFLAVELLL